MKRLSVYDMVQQVIEDSNAQMVKQAQAEAAKAEPEKEGPGPDESAEHEEAEGETPHKEGEKTSSVRLMKLADACDFLADNLHLLADNRTPTEKLAEYAAIHELLTKRAEGEPPINPNLDSGGGHGGPNSAMEAMPNMTSGTSLDAGESGEATAENQPPMVTAPTENPQPLDADNAMPTNEGMMMPPQPEEVLKQEGGATKAAAAYLKSLKKQAQVPASNIGIRLAPPVTEGEARGEMAGRRVGGGVGAGVGGLGGGVLGGLGLRAHAMESAAPLMQEIAQLKEIGAPAEEIAKLTAKLPGKAKLLGLTALGSGLGLLGGLGLGGSLGRQAGGSIGESIGGAALPSKHAQADTREGNLKTPGVPFRKYPNEQLPDPKAEQAKADATMPVKEASPWAKLKTKLAEDAYFPAQIAAGTTPALQQAPGVPSQLSQGSEAGELTPRETAPNVGEGSGRELLSDNNAAINATKGSAKAQNRGALAELLNEPALSAAHDKVLHESLNATPSAGVKLAAKRALIKKLAKASPQMKAKIAALVKQAQGGQLTPEEELALSSGTPEMQGGTGLMNGAAGQEISPEVLMALLGQQGQEEAPPAGSEDMTSYSQMMGMPGPGTGMPPNQPPMM